MRRVFAVLVSAAAALQLGAGPAGAGILGPKGDDPDEKRATVRQEGAEMLQELYREKPELQAKIAGAPGYATFSMLNMNLLLMASGNGYGVLKDNRSGRETFMRVASLGAGAGMGVKNFRAVFVFNDPAVLERFVTQGWQFGVQVDAAATARGEGVAVGESATVDTAGQGGVSSGAGEVLGVAGPMEIYQFTETGIALQAVASGTKYWRDGKLNE